MILGRETPASFENRTQSRVNDGKLANPKNGMGVRKADNHRRANTNIGLIAFGVDARE